MDNLCIGINGKKELMQSTQSVIRGEEDMTSFIQRFREQHSRKPSNVQNAIRLLRAGGMSRDQIDQDLVNKLTRNLLKMVAKMPFRELDALFYESFPFINVKQLQLVPMRILERMQTVSPMVWKIIVENGLEASPYIDLPLILKRRLWVNLSEPFRYEVIKLADSLPSFVEPSTIEEMLININRTEARKANMVLSKFMSLLDSSRRAECERLLVMFIDFIVQKAASEKMPVRRLAIANIFHDLICCIPDGWPQNIEALRALGLALDLGGANGEMTSHQVETLCLALQDEHSCGPIALLLSSSYSRELITLQLLSALHENRKPLPQNLAPSHLAVRGAELKRDVHLKNLVYLSQINIQAHNVLVTNQALPMETSEEFFMKFFPLLTSEMAIDQMQTEDSFHRGNARVPNRDLVLAAANSPFERRVLANYGLALASQGCIVSVSKLRLALDVVLQHANALEEVRECAMSFELIAQIMEA